MRYLTSPKSLFSPFLFTLVALSSSAAQSQVSPAASVPFSSWNANTSGLYLMATCTDQQERFWVTTEDKGVSCYDPKRKSWLQFPAKENSGQDGLYAITADQEGRVWVGTAREGVRVWNGKEWRTYGVLDGPIGERVFTIAVAPNDGSVWIGTNAGLTRYNPKTDKWQHFTRSSGLPSDQIYRIAFDSKGNIIIGTQCDGLALADASNEYSKWRTVSGLRTPDVVPFGKGVGSAQVNDILVTSDNTIYAATSCGLAWSKDAGKTWSYVRGENYGDKVRGRYGGPPYTRWQPKPGAVLKEDYVTCLAESAGQLWVGYRQRGWDCFDLKTQARVRGGESDYVRAILTREGKTPLLATYGSGLVEVPEVAATSSARSTSIAPTKEAKPHTSVAARFPAPQTAPTLAQMQSMLRQLARVRVERPQAVSVPKAQPVTTSVSTSKPLSSTPTRASGVPKVFTLNDDWTTRGNWIDRYGRFAIQLCAMGGGGFDFHDGYRAAWWEVRSYIGRNNSKNNGVKPGQNDQLRYYVTWPRTDDERSLQNPTMGGRKQAEWDDHAETYPMSHDGPHVYATLKIPKGRYVLSCYIFNKDGWSDANRWRDYLLQVKPTPMEYSKFDKLGLVGRDAESIFEKATGAESRVVDFRGGVWKRFLIDARNDEYWTIAVKKNSSFNTILSAIALDPIADLGGPEGPVRQPPQLYKARYKLDVEVLPKTSRDAALLSVDRLLYLRNANPDWYFLYGRKFVLPIISALLSKNKEGNSLASGIDKKQKAPNWRPDIAALLNDIQQFDKRDVVFYSSESYLSYSYAGKTKSGDNWSSWEWNQDEYEEFIKEKQNKHSW